MLDLLVFAKKKSGPSAQEELEPIQFVKPQADVSKDGRWAPKSSKKVQMSTRIVQKSTSGGPQCLVNSPNLQIILYV